MCEDKNKIKGERHKFSKKICKRREYKDLREPKSRKEKMKRMGSTRCFGSMFEVTCNGV